LNAVNQFEEILDELLKELYQLNNFHLLNKHLKKKTGNSEDLAAMNRAPGFFQLSLSAFQNAAVMGLAKLYEPSCRGSMNLNKFLNIIEGNHKAIFLNDLSTKEKLNQSLDIDNTTVQIHREEIKNHERIIENLLAWRDKSFAHNDKKYIFNREMLSKDFPITYKEFENLIELADEILNTYKIGYSGSQTHIIPSNAFDVDVVLEELKK